MWRVIDMDLGFCRYADDYDMPYDVEEMYLHALERSQGQLVETNIEYFGSDQLLYRISTRLSKLKRLRLAHCDPHISGKALNKAVKKCPELEELHLFFLSEMKGRDIEDIGYSCPKLKSFTFNDRGYTSPSKDDQHALAVAKSMPSLRHLRLFGNGMTNEGMEAILEGCPRLESLDIRQCFNVVLEGDIGKRCSMQIKHLRHPSDSTADYECDDMVFDNTPNTDPYYLALLEEMHSGDESEDSGNGNDESGNDIDDSGNDDDDSGNDNDEFTSVSNDSGNVSG